MHRSTSSTQLRSSAAYFSALNKKIEAICRKNDVLRLELRHLQKNSIANEPSATREIANSEQCHQNPESSAKNPEKPEDSPTSRSSPAGCVFPAERFINNGISMCTGKSMTKRKGALTSINGCCCECHRLVHAVFEDPICCDCYGILSCQHLKSPNRLLEYTPAGGPDLPTGTIRAEVENVINQDLALKRLDQVRWCAEYEQMLFHFKGEHPRLRNVQSVFRALLMTAPFKQLHFSDDCRLHQRSANAVPSSWKRSISPCRDDEISRLPIRVKEYLEDSFASEIVESLNCLSTLYIEARRQYLHESSINQKNRVIHIEQARRQQRELRSKQARMQSQVSRTRAFLKTRETHQLARVDSIPSPLAAESRLELSATRESPKMSTRTTRIITKLKETVDNGKICDCSRTVQMTTEYSHRVQRFGGGRRPNMLRNRERQLLERCAIRIQSKYRSHLAYIYVNALRLISFIWRIRFDQARGKLLREEFENLYAQLCFKATIEKAHFVVFTLTMVASSSPASSSHHGHIMIEYAPFQVYWNRSMYRASSSREMIEFLAFARRQEQKLLDEMDRMRKVPVPTTDKRRELWDKVRVHAIAGVTSQKKEVSRAILDEMEKTTQLELTKRRKKKDDKKTADVACQEDVEQLITETNRIADEKAKAEMRALAVVVAAQEDERLDVVQHDCKPLRKDGVVASRANRSNQQPHNRMELRAKEGLESNKKSSLKRASRRKPSKKNLQPQLSLIEIQIDKLLRCIENARQVLTEFPGSHGIDQPDGGDAISENASTGSAARNGDVATAPDGVQNLLPSKGPAASSNAAIVLERQEHLNEIFRLSWASRVSETVNRLSEPSKSQVKITSTQLRATRRYVEESMRIMNFLRHSLKRVGSSKPQLGPDMLLWNEKFEQQIRLLDSNLQLVYHSVED